MACCCKGCSKVSTSCLGRCDLPKHRCLDKEEVKPGPIPKYMGWLWDARDSPEHQLRCGWRPGHISCPVLRAIEMHNCGRSACCVPRLCRQPCTSCGGSPKSCCGPPACGVPCLPMPPCPKIPCSAGQSIIRIIRHAGNYTISTKPSNVSNAPNGPYPLKYVLNVDPNEKAPKDVKYKYSVEAKFNDYRFDYTTSQTSFVLDFSPPEPKCFKPCPKKLVSCLDPCPKPCC